MGKCRSVLLADLRVVMRQPCVRDRLDAGFPSVVLQGVQFGPSSRILQLYTVYWSGYHVRRDSGQQLCVLAVSSVYWQDVALTWLLSTA